MSAAQLPDQVDAVVVGAGGTAPAAVVALAGLGMSELTVVARNPVKASRLVDLGAYLGVSTIVREFGAPDLAATAAAADVLISTIPPEAAERYSDVFASAPVLLDAIYEPWPTPLAQAVTAAGGEAISGLQMLLHQAFSQVEQFTGRPAPRSEMAAALT